MSIWVLGFWGLLEPWRYGCVICHQAADTRSAQARRCWTTSPERLPSAHDKSRFLPSGKTCQKHGRHAVEYEKYLGDSSSSPRETCHKTRETAHCVVRKTRFLDFSQRSQRNGFPHCSRSRCVSRMLPPGTVSPGQCMAQEHQKQNTNKLILRRKMLCSAIFNNTNKHRLFPEPQSAAEVVGHVKDTQPRTRNPQGSRLVGEKPQITADNRVASGAS